MRDAATGKRKRKWHSLDAREKREAQIECARLISEIQGGTYLEPNKTTLASSWTGGSITSSRRYRPNPTSAIANWPARTSSRYSARSILTKLKPAEYRQRTPRRSPGPEGRKGRLSPQTVDSHAPRAQTGAWQAVRWELLHRNPADAVDPPKVRARQMKPMT